MKELEEALKKLPKPNIEVEAFKHDLRRSLKRSMVQDGSKSWPFALPVAVGTAAACAFLLVLFVMKPELPSQLNRMVAGPSPAQPVVEQPMVQPAIAEHQHDDYLSRLLAAGNAGEDVDRQYIESLYHQSQTPQPVEVKSLTGQRVFAMRQFELSSGKQVVVWTELTEDGNVRIVNNGPVF